MPDQENNQSKEELIVRYVLEGLKGLEQEPSPGDYMAPILIAREKYA